MSFFFIAHALTVSVRLVCRRKRLRLRAVRDCILKSSSSFGICFKRYFAHVIVRAEAWDKPKGEYSTFLIL